MGRRKLYDRTELLDKAVELFRRQGYNGTGVADLVAELGVNRKSLYSEFGSKQQLFESVLERYNSEHLSRVLAPIDAPDAGVDAIRDAFAGYATASQGWFFGRGCLLCNTAVERAALDPGSARYVAEYLERLTRAFGKALENGQAAGDVDRAADVEELASYLPTMLIGVAACIRAEAPPDQIQAACKVAMATLDSYRPIASS